MRHLLVVLPFAFLFAATPTRAEDASPYDVRTGVNVNVQTSDSGGVGVHAQALFRIFYLAAGVHTGANFWLAKESGGAAVDLGFALRTPHFRAELLGYAGGARHAHIGRKRILANDPGGSITLPYAGGALNLFYVRELRPRRSLLIGGSFMAERDLRDEHVDYTYDDCGWLDEGCDTEHGSIEAGWLRFGFGVLVGVQFDLGRTLAHAR